MTITASDITLSGQAALNRLTRRYRLRRAADRYWSRDDHHMPVWIQGVLGIAFGLILTAFLVG